MSRDKHQSKSILLCAIHSTHYLQLVADVESDEIACRPICPYGQFGLPRMHRCQHWLRCAEIEAEVRVQEPLNTGAVKAVSHPHRLFQEGTFSVLHKLLQALSVSETFTNDERQRGHTDSCVDFNCFA